MLLVLSSLSLPGLDFGSILPDSATYGALFNDRKLYMAILVAALSGVMRGFSGFGSAVIYVPLMAMIFGPRLAAATLLLIDLTSGLPFAITAFSSCDRREIKFMITGAVVGVPLGTLLLAYGDPVILRWIMAVFVIFIVLIGWRGWKINGSAKGSSTFGAGIVSGFFGGAIQMDGPPAVIYWLSSAASASTIRANLMVFIVFSGALICIVYYSFGLLTPNALALASVLWSFFVISMSLGAFIFKRSTETSYRTIAYLVILVGALISLPIFDVLWQANASD